MQKLFRGYMHIGVISFGSLVNHPTTLEVKRPQNETRGDYNIDRDSPFVPAPDLKLPICLGRVSKEDKPQRRITLVLDEHASPETVFYAISKFTNLNDAIKNLREREGISLKDHIGYVNRNAGTSRSRIDRVTNDIGVWADRMRFDAVVWTDLPRKGATDILSLLNNDNLLLKNTKNYINTLPYQTPLQQRIVTLANYRDSLTADFAHRDTLKQTDVDPADWFNSNYGRWGPKAKTFPEPIPPQGVDQTKWKRDRVIEAAKHFIGLKYERNDGQRGHFPARGCGLDCSNFAAWVYNYALGIKISSSVDRLASNFIGRNEPLKKGDLILLEGNPSPRHVVIYIDQNHVIDSTSTKTVGIRDIRLRGNEWYTPDYTNRRYLGARRII